ncbi:MAG: hypothetical protein AB7H90_05270 [Alphaproteobacteria bacterium]
MGDWSAWFRVVKETGPGRKYLYLQRVRRVPGSKNPEAQSRSLGRINPNPVPRRRRPFVAAEYEQSAGGLGLLLFGFEDDYGRPRDSLYNRVFHKDRLEARWAEENPKPPPEKTPKFYDRPPEPKNEEPATEVTGTSEEVFSSSGAGNGEDSDSSE